MQLSRYYNEMAKEQDQTLKFAKEKLKDPKKLQVLLSVGSSSKSQHTNALENIEKLASQKYGLADFEVRDSIDSANVEFDLMILLDDFKRTTKTILAIVAGIPIYKASFISNKSRKKSGPEDEQLWLNDRAFIKKKD